MKVVFDETFSGVRLIIYESYHPTLGIIYITRKFNVINTGGKNAGN